MLCVYTKKIIGMQAYFAQKLGAKPYIWDFKTHRIRFSHSTRHWAYWKFTICFIWFYQVALIFKYLYHLNVEPENFNITDRLFHAFWIALILVASIFNASTVVYLERFISYINMTLDIDEHFKG